VLTHASVDFGGAGSEATFFSGKRPGRRETDEELQVAKLYFSYASMGAGKSAYLLQTNFNYTERGMTSLLLTAALDDRYGAGKITSRIGMEADAKTFAPTDDLLETFILPALREGVSAVLVDEAQFLQPEQVWQLAEAVDRFDVPVMCFGLRTSFTGDLFPGSAALLAAADQMREIKTICCCGKKATYVLRKDATGQPTFSGAQVQIGGNDSYLPVCRKHWMEAWIAAGRPRIPGTA